MNGKITVKRRQERSGHRLQARLRTPGLVRPGAAVETRPVRPPLPGPRARAAFGANPGGTAEGFAFRPRDGMRGVFIFILGVRNQECGIDVPPAAAESNPPAEPDTIIPNSQVLIPNSTKGV